MASVRIRNGLDLEALAALEREPPEPPACTAQVEWVGGVQSVATISRPGRTDGAGADFVFRVDDATQHLGSGAGPAPMELAAVALSAAFAQAYVVEATLADVPVDALTVSARAVETSAANAGTRWHIECSVAGEAPASVFQDFARRASTSASVRRLTMRRPVVSVVKRAGGAAM